MLKQLMLIILNAFDIVKYKKLIITETAVKEIEKRYS